MSKLRLGIEDLRVDSFDTLGDAARQSGGTVYGRADIIVPITRTQDPVACTYQTGPTCPECPVTYHETCRRTCQADSCDICVDPTVYTD